MYSTVEEERIENNLKDVAYELDTPATVALVTGEGRIERVRLAFECRGRLPNPVLAVHLPTPLPPTSTSSQGAQVGVSTRLGR